MEDILNVKEMLQKSIEELGSIDKKKKKIMKPYIVSLFNEFKNSKVLREYLEYFYKT